MKTSVTLFDSLSPSTNEQYPGSRKPRAPENCWADQPLARERIEVIVVDDGSTDRTRAILRQFESSESAAANGKFELGLRSIHEANQGKGLPRSHTALQARNNRN